MKKITVRIEDSTYEMLKEYSLNNGLRRVYFCLIVNNAIRDYCRKNMANYCSNNMAE